MKRLKVIVKTPTYNGLLTIVEMMVEITNNFRLDDLIQMVMGDFVEIALNSESTDEFMEFMKMRLKQDGYPIKNNIKQKGE